MNIKRLNVVRKDDKVYADYDGRLLRVVNPEDIPSGYADGIFTIDAAHGTASFESRKAESPYTGVVRRKFTDIYPSAVWDIPQGGKFISILDGAASVTIHEDVAYVNAPKLSKDARRLLAGLAFEGFDMGDMRIANALRYALQE